MLPRSVVDYNNIIVIFRAWYSTIKNGFKWIGILRLKLRPRLTTIYLGFYPSSLDFVAEWNDRIFTQSRDESKILWRWCCRMNHCKQFPKFRCAELPLVLCSSGRFLPVSLNHDENSIYDSKIIVYKFHLQPLNVYSVAWTSYLAIIFSIGLGEAWRGFIYRRVSLFLLYTKSLHIRLSLDFGLWNGYAYVSWLDDRREICFIERRLSLSVLLFLIGARRQFWRLINE